MATMLSIGDAMGSGPLQRQIEHISNEMASLATMTDAVSIEQFRALTAERAGLLKERDKKAKRAATPIHRELTEDERVQRAEDIAVIKADLRAWLEERDYYYVQATDRFWLHKPTSGEWLMNSERALKMDRRSLTDRVEFDLLLDVMREDGRYKDTLTYSFRDEPNDVLNMLRTNFIPPIDDGQPPHWLFETVIRSIGGDKAENIEHIEKLVLAKYLHPEDITLPALVLQDDGGTGKSLFVSVVLGTLFGQRHIADNLSMGDIVGKFNSRLEGKVLWFVNESAKGTYSLDDLKRKLGSTTFAIERKGIDAISVPMIAWMIISGNDASGSVLVSNNDTDRRYSIIKGRAPLHSYTAPALGISSAEAVKWIKDTGSKILADPAEVGRWVQSLIAKHGDPGSVTALHGEDYATLAETQTSIEDSVFQAVFLKPEFTYIRRPVLYDFYRSQCQRQGRPARRDRVFYEMAGKWLKKVGLDFITAKANIGSGCGSTSGHIYYRPDPLASGTPRVNRNDHEWFSIDRSSGRITWLIEVD